MKIVTWNMQGGTNAGYINQVIQATEANVLCLQETGNMTSLLQGTAPVAGFPGSLRGNFAAGNDFFECIFWNNAAWVQGSLAVMANVHVVDCNIMAAAAAPYIPPNPRNLPWMEVTNPDTGATIRIFSIHSPPVWGAVTIANACAWSNAQVAAVDGAAAAPWTIVGDFNADPTEAGFMAPPAGAVVRGARATQQSGILDYSITNIGVGYTYNAAGELVGASDHYPQEFNW